MRGVGRAVPGQRGIRGAGAKRAGTPTAPEHAPRGRPPRDPDQRLMFTTLLVENVSSVPSFSTTW
jgi:hypothetical protein